MNLYYSLWEFRPLDLLLLVAREVTRVASNTDVGGSKTDLITKQLAYVSVCGLFKGFKDRWLAYEMCGKWELKFFYNESKCYGDLTLFPRKGHMAHWQTS